MKNVYISVVSHRHSKLIRSINCLSILAKKYNVIIKSNCTEDFGNYLKNTNIVHINSDYGLGFGHNNNFIFNYCKNKLNMKKDDLFIVMNPDVSITIEQFELLIDSMSKDSIEFATINLFKDKALSIYDPSIRNFPKLSTFIRSYLLNENPTIIDRSKIYKQTEVDWAAGSFLCFSAMHYEKLGGFDEKYFMYCEDIDICFRSKKSRVDLVYLPNVKAQHLARHNNRKLISKHFYWHIKSVIRFLYSRNFSVKNKSSIKKYEQ